MKYQKIFWLEDSPDIFGDVLRICAKHGIEQDSLFSRTTFAPDYQAGAEIVQKQEFDLHILDGDFPEAASQDWKKHYWEFMQKISLGTKHLDFLRYFKNKKGDKYGDGYLGRSTNNFSRFFDQFLRGRDKTVVYSISTFAIPVAFHFGLPFYSKALGKDMIRDGVKESLNYQGVAKYIPIHIRPKTLDFLTEWEYGSRFDFVERYLI